MTQIKIPTEQVRIFFEGTNCSFTISAGHILVALQEYLGRQQQVVAEATYSILDNQNTHY